MAANPRGKKLDTKSSQDWPAQNLPHDRTSTIARGRTVATSTKLPYTDGARQPLGLKGLVKFIDCSVSRLKHCSADIVMRAQQRCLGALR